MNLNPYAPAGYILLLLAFILWISGQVDGLARIIRISAAALCLLLAANFFDIKEWQTARYSPHAVATGIVTYMHPNRHKGSYDEDVQVHRSNDTYSPIFNIPTFYRSIATLPVQAGAQVSIEFRSWDLQPILITQDGTHVIWSADSSHGTFLFSTGAAVLALITAIWAFSRYQAFRAGDPLMLPPRIRR